MMNEHILSKYQILDTKKLKRITVKNKKFQSNFVHEREEQPSRKRDLLTFKEFLGAEKDFWTNFFGLQ